MTAAEFKTARKGLGLSAKKMADALGVCERSVWYWEEGKRPVPKPIELLIQATGRS